MEFDIVTTPDPMAAWYDARLPAIASCKAKNGEHAWQLLVDAGSATVQCEFCPAGMNEIYADGDDLLYALIPVTIDIEVTEHRNYEYANDYSVYINAEVRNK